MNDYKLKQQKISQGYTEAQTEIADKIVRLQSYLKEHTELRDKANKLNWGYVGDLRFINSHLNDIMKFVENKI